jgi:hypothetical protein
VQSTWGLLTAVTVYGAAMGGLFALAFVFLYGRTGPVRPRVLALLLALAAFVTLYYVPSLKYPPPAIGDPDTIGFRTGLYLLMMLIALTAMVSAIAAVRRLAERQDTLNAVLAGAAIFVAIVVAAQIVLPDINEVPAGFPATVLWKFRMASLGMQAMTWSTIGLVFGGLAERSLGGSRRGDGDRWSVLIKRILLGVIGLTVFDVNKSALADDLSTVTAPKAPQFQYGVPSTYDWSEFYVWGAYWLCRTQVELDRESDNRTRAHRLRVAQRHATD